MTQQRAEATRTNRETYKLVQRLLGEEYSSNAYERILELSVDGIKIGDVKPRLQKKGSIYYHKDFQEIKEVANMLVELNLDNQVLDIKKREKPDIEISFDNKSPVYIEHTNIFDHGMPFDRHLEQAKLQLLDLAKRDEELRFLLENKYCNVYLSDPGLLNRVSSGREIAVEMASWLKMQSGKVFRTTISAEHFPILNRYRARLTYDPQGPAGELAFNRDAHAFSPNDPWIFTQLTRAIERKNLLASNYEATCRPLWLLISLQGDDLFAEHEQGYIRNVIHSSEIGMFDAVVVRLTGMKPVVKMSSDSITSSLLHNYII